ncbi:MAG: phosphotransferase family protein [Alphaproteobacteria bacterium]
MDSDPILAALRRIGLVGPAERPRFVPLAGGVSSDIWRVEAAIGTFCVKRALERLKVAQHWTAPVVRNAYEVAWFEVAGSIVPDAVPRVIGHEARDGMFVMSYLDPDTHPLWKEQLRQGHADPVAAAAVGRRLARIHAATAGNEKIAERFRTDLIFHAIRLEPYLFAAARAHPTLAEPLTALATRTATTRLALVHGDISPKNILHGPNGPVFLDAECAWYGDPAFDAAFCLNHLLLKCLWTPRATDGFLACFEALGTAWCAGVAWEAPAAAEARVATLLPGLLLARIDGKSPVEYVTDDRDRQRARAVAMRFLGEPVDRLEPIRAAWAEQMADA